MASVYLLQVEAAVSAHSVDDDPESDTDQVPTLEHDKTSAATELWAINLYAKRIASRENDLNEYTMPVYMLVPSDRRPSEAANISITSTVAFSKLEDALRNSMSYDAPEIMIPLIRFFKHAAAAEDVSSDGHSRLAPFATDEMNNHLKSYTKWIKLQTGKYTIKRGKPAEVKGEINKNFKDAKLYFIKFISTFMIRRTKLFPFNGSPLMTLAALRSLTVLCDEPSPGWKAALEDAFGSGDPYYTPRIRQILTNYPALLRLTPGETHTVNKKNNKLVKK